MEITNVGISLKNTEGTLRAYASVTFDDEFVVKNIKITETEKGLAMSMPRRKIKLTEDVDENDPEIRAKLYTDIAHPINAAAREKLEKAIFAKYEEELKKSQEV